MKGVLFVFLLQFVLDYPNELITSVEGTISTDSWADILSLTIKTSKGRTISFGRKSNDVSKFVLEKKGNAIVGFYGWTQYYSLKALGAYYRPFPTPPDENLLEAKGGDGGASWDDGGSFDGVRRIYIGLSQNSVSFIKFIYYKSYQLVFGEDHGNKTKIGLQEFELNYPSEYITTVEGTYDTKSGVITMLRFKTNKQTSPPFGLVTTSGFILQKADHKIVGFHHSMANPATCFIKSEST
ncbi:PREDICTED: jacalin-related lectin 44-like [Camelina sativa]|uniref:Jacalin-related lectin 44-like n=1 Tax=Camelina sativa TaxID=90675 RepID=A0ABM1R6E7_CAMSA|nr:PREDICTED: jacalin-related lectin 44-like [Camelina sativa]